MHCPKCGFENSDNAIFCTNCGMQIKVTCPECGASNHVGSIFCAQCGFRIAYNTLPDKAAQRKNEKFQFLSPTSLIPQIDPYERRIVTILFADIIGSTTFAEIIDPENVAEIMSGAYPCLLEPIQDYNGLIVQVMGDGVLAYFGAPLSLEDDPERAVLAGLEIVARVESYAKKLHQEGVLENFHVRVGINTGLVVVGEMNPEKHLEYLALGDAVNLAARLQQNAPDDSVLISHTTYQHVKGLFDVQEQAPLIVKGREQIEHTYLVDQQRPYQLRLQQRGLEGVATTMVGREPEMAALKNIYSDAIQGGETALVLVNGDPGIGKTRLVNEFAAWVNSQSISPVILRGRAIPGTQDVPYGVLRYMFARKFGILETDTSAQALEKFRRGTQNYIDKEQADLIGQFIGFDFKSSLQIHQLMGSTDFGDIAALYLKNYLRSLAEKSLLIILEDLQWMDNRTLDFISEFVIEFGGGGELQLMILCTARTQFFEERPKWGEGILGFTKMNLRSLSRLQSRALIEEILFKSGDIPEVFYQCVIDEAGGNPFFIEEMIKMFIDEDVISTMEGSLLIRLEKLADLHVPSTLSGILLARLDSLSLPERQVVQRASIIGRTFWDGLLRALTEDGVESQKVNLRLEVLRDRGLIYHREHSSIAGNQEYLFKHALLCDEAYETVLLKHRRNYHKQVAIWIEENAGDRLDEHLALIANNYLKAGENGLAADWFTKAGERAFSLCSVNEAKILFERALNLITDQDLNRLWRATLGHDEAVGTLGDLDARHADDKTLLNLASRFEDESLIAEAYSRVGYQAYREGSFQEAISAFDNALDILQKTNDTKMQATILPMKISILVSKGDLQAAGSLVEGALALAQQTEDADILARAQANIAIYYQAIGDITESLHLTQQQIDINQQQGNRLGETYGLINLGYYLLSLGQFEKAHTALERALKVARKLHAKSCIAYSLLNLGMTEWRLEKPQKAVEVLKSSLDVLTELGDQRGLASREYYLGLAYESANECIEAEKYFNLAINSYKMLGAKGGMAEAQAGLARLALRGGENAKAEDLAIQVISCLDEEGPECFELPILAYLSCVKVFAAVEDKEMVQQTLAEGSREIQNRLGMIRDADLKAVFLDAIPENRELLAYQQEGVPDVVVNCD